MLPAGKYGNIEVIEKRKSGTALPEFLSEKETASVRRFHESIEGYCRTPLVSLGSFAKRSGVRAVLVKDESPRFGLNAFKALGGTYALFRVICGRLDLDPDTATMADLQANRDKLADMVFITTTDGNHGKGVSWGAGLLGCKSHVYMPRNSAEVRAQAIRDAGNAEVTITDMSYDDCVRYTAKLAEENGWYLIQDTSWEGYEDIPTWIVQGYTTLFYEAAEQMRELGIEQPTHIFLQAGVGAMAGGIAGAAVCTYRGSMPVISVVEPTEVACIFESARIDDGEAHKAAGSEETIMAGLNCAEPCLVTWPVLRDFADFYFRCDDGVAAHGMRFYARPQGHDRKIISGESGSVTGGLTALILGDEKYAELRERLGVDENSVILLINSEGDTDPENYKNIVENGAYPLKEI